MNTSNIMTLDELSSHLEATRTEGSPAVALCHGVFDLLHVGHIRHLKEAREFADILIVTVTPDEHVNKGPNRPAFTGSLRLEALAAMSCVDYVALNTTPYAMSAIEAIRPDFYVKGSEFRDLKADITGKIIEEKNAVESFGGKLVFTDDIVFSSSSLLNEHFMENLDDVKPFLDAFKPRYSFDDVKQYIDGCSGIKALVVGESIIDEYVFCRTIGKAGKEPILVAKSVSSERSPGGVLAAANHVAAFCDHVSLVTPLGASDTQEEYLRSSLNPNIDATMVPLEGIPTMIKRRYVEEYPFQKLFEIYNNDDMSDCDNIADFISALEERVPQADVVIVTDYGHGILEGDALRVLCENAKFLAVNTQKNAGNHGFNTISKYERADLVCLSESELRLDARDRRADLETLIQRVAEQLSCPCVTVTRGEQGCMSLTASEGFVSVPALTRQIRDRVGAGDAVFSVVSMLASQGAPASILGLVGNAVGAQAVATVGNRHPVDKVTTEKHIMHLLK